ncbi:hypothetical protein EW146_g8988 [Bondarzewia mesenterica]|uniref:Uncharacterized protein n=1 Tax=Bondarzewia mesenterica TaxID=1095465 RepID=A0A4V3XD57_9AGAM|nr:hypothetical protein EW146_g8988 [Bondarzewia mesenterica]
MPEHSSDATNHSIPGFQSHTLSSDQSVSTLGSESDPASSLRQAALLTLRSKRRKATAASVSSTSLSSRPTPTTSASIVLDYGQEEPSSEAASFVAPSTSSTLVPVLAPSSGSSVTEPPPSRPPRKGETSVPPVQEEDTTMREEGEISDNEGPPSPPKRLHQISSSLDATGVSQTPRTLATSGPAPAAAHLPTSPPILVSQRPVVKTEPASLRLGTPSPPPRPTLPDRLVLATPHDASADSFRLDDYLIDVNHVRPGLSMTHEQYTAAKDIVLDLLGWGVPPEYLVECGLSREIVYYVFTELNLRLPTNLDSTGILPFPPTPKMVASWLERSASTAHAPSAKTETPSPLQSRAPAGHLLPPKPTSVVSEASLAPTPSKAPIQSSGIDIALTMPSKPQSPPIPSLADMEQQRRQELLARKAVQASRKRKESCSSGASTASLNDSLPMDVDDDRQPLVPEASVDDFLNSIEPVTGDTIRGNGFDMYQSSVLLVASPETMDIDDAIPGLGGGSFVEFLPGPNLSSSAAVHSTEVQFHRTRSGSRSSMDLSDVASSSDESKEKGSTMKRKSGPNVQDKDIDELQYRESNGETPTLPSGSSFTANGPPTSVTPPVRRGNRRPVAADFVDLDSAYSSNPYAISAPSRQNSMGSVFNGVQHPNPHVRRKMNAVALGGGFASVSGMRRCVIDLSDSEEEDEEQEQEEWMAPSPAVRPASAASSITGSVLGSGTPNNATELEMEIKRMREMIRAREELRQKKLALLSSRPNSTSTPAPIITPTTSPSQAGLDRTSFAVKQEVLESLPSYTPREAATSPPSSEESERDVVMSNIEEMPGGRITTSVTGSLAIQTPTPTAASLNGDMLSSTPNGHPLSHCSRRQTCN